MKALVKCLHCNKIFEAYKCWDRKYCSEDCYIMGMAGNANALGNKKDKMVLVTCIGPLCRGHKKFKSYHHSHKFGLCHLCTVHNRGICEVMNV